MPHRLPFIAGQAPEIDTDALVRVLVEYRKAVRVLAYHDAAAPLRKAMQQTVAAIETELQGRGVELLPPVEP